MIALSDYPSVTPALRDPSTTVMRTNNFAVFVIFFGLSLIAALRAHAWGMALLWMAFGVFWSLTLASTTRHITTRRRVSHGVPQAAQLHLCG